MNAVDAGISAAKTIAKLNGATMHGWSTSGTSFFGWQYIQKNNKLYKHGAAVTTVVTGYFKKRDYPTLCIRNDGSATIRWFESPSELNGAIPYCKYMFGGPTALVYGSKSVFDNAVYDSASGKLIYNSANEYDEDCQFNAGLCAASAGEKTAKRSILGHRANGTYLLVATDTDMSLRTAARMMKDLACDYAINLDGGPSTQMRVASGYTNGAAAGVMNNSSGSTYYGSAVIAHLL